MAARTRWCRGGRLRRDLVQLACNDDAAGVQSRVVVTAESGQTIFFQVGGFFGAQGDLVFNILKGKAFPSARPVKISGSSSSAGASFFNTAANGVETSTFVSASDFTFTDPIGTFEGSEVYVDIFQFDPGNPRNPKDDKFREFFGFAELTPVQFQVIGNLDSASLSAAVNVCEFVFEVPSRGRKPPPAPRCFDVDLNLNRGGAGDVSTFSGKSIFRFDGCRVHSTFSDSFRSADVGGTIIGDSTDFTGGAPGFGDISTSTFTNASSGDCFFF